MEWVTKYKTILNLIHYNQNGTDVTHYLSHGDFDTRLIPGSYIFMGHTRATLHSIWTNQDTSKVYLHVTCLHFEGELLYDSLNKANKDRVLRSIKYTLENEQD